MATIAPSQAKPVSPVISVQPTVAPITSAQPVSSQTVAPVVNASPSAQSIPASGQPTQTKPASPQPQTIRPEKPKSKFANLFHKPDWLFGIAVLIAIGQALLLASLENEKNEYAILKAEDADRVYVVQKASSLTQQDLDILERAFLNEKDVISFIQTIETARPTFDEFNLEFTSDEPQGKDVHYLPFSIAAVGAREVVTSFFERLLGSTYAIEVAAMSVKEVEGDPTKVTVLYTGNIYIQNSK